jgi:hypothetical protein
MLFNLAVDVTWLPGASQGPAVGQLCFSPLSLLKLLMCYRISLAAFPTPSMRPVLLASTLSQPDWSHGLLYIVLCWSEFVRFVTRLTRCRRRRNIEVKVFIILLDYKWYQSLVSSGSIVSDYGLDDRAIGVRSPAGAKDFSSSLCIQTGSGAHPASCTMDTRSPYPGGKSAAGA